MNFVNPAGDHGRDVRSAVWIELDFCRNVDASDELLEADRLGSNAASFKADLRYSDHSPGLVWFRRGVVLVLVLVLFGGWLVLAALDQG